MSEFKIHVFHTGEVCVAPDLPFGGEYCSALKASGLFDKKSNRLWLPVSAYLIECERGKILFDCGWSRDMSPNGVFDKKAQIESLGSLALYEVNQGKVEKGQAIDEQLLSIGIKPDDLDLVLLSHLDCDHANGLKSVKNAKKILVSNDELSFASKGLENKIRYNEDWWKDTKIQGFGWNGNEGPAGKSFDVFGDESLVMVNIPGHSDGLCALKIKNKSGKFVLLFSDGGYARKSWQEMITSGIAANKQEQKKSLAWIREQSLLPDCVESLANHDPYVIPHTITLLGGGKMADTVLITGASGGIGKEIAQIYAKNGCNLVLVARNEGKLYKLRSELVEKYGMEAYVFACDLSVRDAAYDVFNYTLENQIRVDILVNNAGFGDFGNFAEFDQDRQNELLGLNIVALTQMTRCFLPPMIKRGHGKILNMSSVAAFCAGPKMSLYYSSKAYVRSFSEAVAEEVKGSGVTVTALCPGPTSTGFEKAAGMKGSNMFTFFKPASAHDVAMAGCKAAEKGRVLCYCGLPVKLMNIGSRLLPRSLTRKFAAKING